jgi:hypothetical protein
MHRMHRMDRMLGGEEREGLFRDDGRGDPLRSPAVIEAGKRAVGAEQFRERFHSFF